MKKYPWPVNTMLIKKKRGAVIHLQIGKEDELANNQFWGHCGGVGGAGACPEPFTHNLSENGSEHFSDNFTSRIFI